MAADSPSNAFRLMSRAVGKNMNTVNQIVLKQILDKHKSYSLTFLFHAFDLDLIVIVSRSDSRSLIHFLFVISFLKCSHVRIIPCNDFVRLRESIAFLTVDIMIMVSI